MIQLNEFIYTAQAENKAAEEARLAEAARLESELSSMTSADQESRIMSQMDELIRPPLTAVKVQQLAAKMVESALTSTRESMAQEMQKQTAALLERIAALEAAMPKKK